MSSEEKRSELLELQATDLKAILTKIEALDRKNAIYEMVEAIYLEIGRLARQQRIEFEKLCQKEKEREEELEELKHGQHDMQEEIERLIDERAHLQGLLGHRDLEIRNYIHENDGYRREVQQLNHEIENLQKGVIDLLQSNRWKVGSFFGRVKSIILLRPREAAVSEYIEKVYNDYKQ